MLSEKVSRGGHAQDVTGGNGQHQVLSSPALSPTYKITPEVVQRGDFPHSIFTVYLIVNSVDDIEGLTMLENCVFSLLRQKGMQSRATEKLFLITFQVQLSESWIMVFARLLIQPFTVPGLLSAAEF